MIWPGLEATQAVQGAASATPGSELARASGAAVTDFGAIVQRGVDAVNQQLLTSQVDLQKLATGDAQNLHQIMIRLEESRLSFQLLMQVRNRLLEAYQEVMRMQV